MKKFGIKKLSFVLFFMVAFLILGLPILIEHKNAVADESISNTVFLPSDLSEVYPLSSPTDALFFNGNVAISQNPDQIVLYIDGEYLDPITINGATSLDQLKLLNKDNLLVLSFNTIYKISLIDYTVSVLTDNNGAPVTCTHYDTDGKYLVAGSSSEGSARIYSVDGVSVVRSGYTIDGINGNKPVCIDSENLIYVKNEKIYSRSITDLSIEPTLLIEKNPDNLIVNREFFYFTTSGKIFKYDKLSTSITELSVKNTYENDDKFNLGFTYDLSNLSFRGDNLAVTSLVNNTIQEFRVNGTYLEFTGYAIASNKTAYNRFLNVKDIQKQGDVVAVLDDLKLSLISPNPDNAYSINRFNNLFINENVKHFALGDKGILYFNESGKVNFYDLHTKDLEERNSLVTEAINFVDVCYRFGYYYFITTDGLNSYFYTYNENSGDLIKNDYSSPDFTLVEADVFGNVYTVDNGKVLFNDEYLLDLSDAIKIQTDFSGNLFALKDGKILKLNKETKAFVPFNIDGTVTSFALSFDTKSVYYTTAEFEGILVTEDLSNYSINSTALPQDFILSKNNANINDLEIYTINENANVYSVNNANGYFVYNSLIDPLSQYAFICNVDYDGVVYKCLAGVNGIVLVYDEFLTNEEPIIQDVDHTVFITTTVHAYYLPLITLDGAHYLDGNNEKVVLAKHTPVKVIKKLNVSDRDFYYAVLDSENNVFAYIPLDFTVKTLSKDVVINEFKIEDFDSPILYLDTELQNEFTRFTEIVSLKVLSVDNGVATILYHTEDGDLICYANSNLILDNQKIWVRNVLIILVLITCVSGTTTYFLLRRKIND